MPHSVHGLIPAAACSTRLDPNDQPVLGEDQPGLRRIVERAFAAGLTKVTVVTGYQEDEVKAQLRGLGCRFVHHSGWECGVGSTLACGVASFADQASAALLILPDQRLVSAVHLARLLAQHEQAPLNLVASKYGNAFGMPALFPARLFREFSTLSDHFGALALLQRFRHETIVLDCSEVDVDCDQPEKLFKVPVLRDFITSRTSGPRHHQDLE